MSTAASVSSTFAAALRGDDCFVREDRAAAQRLPVGRWGGSADPSDLRVLHHCHGPVLDVGCGPGRMSEALAVAGHPALGIDVVPEAVEQTRRRGAPALLRDVFDRVPAEGRWRTVLLADGNIGIGGDPRRLLLRVAALLGPGGRAVVDLAAPGTGVQHRTLRLVTAGLESRPFAWTDVGPDGIEAVADGTGLRLGSRHHDGLRWFAVLTKERER